MDFRQNLSMGANRTESAPAAPSNNNAKKDAPADKARASKWMKILSAVVLVGVVLLVVGVVIMFARSANGAGDDRYLKTDKYQAVFLSNGQVYFGKVAALSRSNIVLRDVFYLTQNSSDTTANASSNTDYTLVKLGCQQIHYPEDQMVVSRDQITFWENLNNDGKVVKSINEFKKQNPNGENCSTTTNDTQSTNSGTDATQNSSNTTNTNTNNSTSTGN